MTVRVATVAFNGTVAQSIDVQVALSPGLPAFALVGLADKAVTESRERVRAALGSMGLSLPAKRILVNLAPADLQKEGSHYDLPIALGLLAAMGAVPSESFENLLAMGELALDGRILPVPGVLPAAMHATATGATIACPAANGPEAAWAAPGAVLAAPDLLSLVNHLRGIQLLASPQPAQVSESAPRLDMAHVKGQALARRALEVAAAGAHNLLMSGPPGAGKSMLAGCLPGILPPLSAEEMLEVSVIGSIAGQLNAEGLATARPFRSPHHSASMAAMVGGGRKVVPGEISLAHHGVLFMDELPEFPRAVLEALRQPLESGEISVARVASHATFPAACQLIGAMNPCRCGYLGDPARACAKAPRCGEEYSGKLSGPLLDRIDLHIEVAALETAEMLRAEPGESSALVRARVTLARSRQTARREALGIPARTNATLRGDDIARACILTPEAQTLMETATARLRLSMRGYGRTLKVARTIADLAGSEVIETAHVAEALSYRQPVMMNAVAA